MPVTIGVPRETFPGERRVALTPRACDAIGKLGAGAMGQVFLARSTAGRLVAVKTIRVELAEEPGYRAAVSTPWRNRIVDSQSITSVPGSPSGPGPGMGMAATCAAMVMKTPAEAARAPVGAT